MLNQIKTLLNIEVRLEERKLENGTRVEAESFEKGKEIFILTDDEKSLTKFHKKKKNLHQLQKT